MESLLHKVLKVLRDQVNQNNDEIRYNQDDINRLLSEQNITSNSNELESKYSLNRELLNENNDLINFQLSISEFIEKYGYLFTDLEETSDILPKLAENSGNGPDKIFINTIEGKLKYDKNHPYYNKPGFFLRLLQYYESQENYEMCEYLLRINENQS